MARTSTNPAYAYGCGRCATVVGFPCVTANQKRTKPHAGRLTGQVASPGRKANPPDPDTAAQTVIESTEDDHVIILWRTGTEAWQYGRSIPAWVLDDEEARATQRKAVRDHVRAEYIVPDGGPIQTRIFTATEAADLGF